MYAKLSNNVNISFVRPDLTIDSITLEMIARGLAREYRYAGQTPVPYSVAEHCIWGATHNHYPFHVPEEDKPLLRKAFLLHDASEGLGMRDLPRNLKTLCPQYKVLEDRMMGCVYRRFGVELNEGQKKILKAMDDYAGAVEMNWVWDFTGDQRKEDSIVAEFMTVARRVGLYN